MEIRETDRGEVTEALDADVAAPPFRKELPVERVEPLELEDVVDEQDPAADDPPDRRLHSLGSEEVRQGAEVERELARAGVARPGERLDHEKLGQAVRRIRAPAHRAQRPAAPGERGREVEKAADPALRVFREGEHGAGDVEVVDRHREAPLRLAAPPRGRDVLELGLQRRRDLVCRNYAERVPRLPEPGDGLAHLADRTSLERELARVEHGLLPDRHGLEPERAIALEMRVGGADDREPPAARAGDPAQLREEVVDLRLVADRIAADEGRSRDDAVGEKRAARRREEIALVATQGEEGKAVAAVHVDQLPRHAPLPHRLGDSVSERTQPEVERERAEDDSEAEERVTGAGRQLEAADLRSARNRRDPREGCSEAEQRPDARGVTGHIETAPPAKERDEQQQGERRLLEVEALRQMRDGGRDDDRDRELPGATSASLE